MTDWTEAGPVHQIKTEPRESSAASVCEIVFTTSVHLSGPDHSCSVTRFCWFSFDVLMLFVISFDLSVSSQSQSAGKYQQKSKMLLLSWTNSRVGKRCTRGSNDKRVFVVWAELCSTFNSASCIRAQWATRKHFWLTFPSNVLINTLKLTADRRVHYSLTSSTPLEHILWILQMSARQHSAPRFLSFELVVHKDGCRKEKEGGASSRSREIIHSRELMK